MDVRSRYTDAFGPQITFLQELAPRYVVAVKNYTSSDYYEQLNRKMCAGIPLSGMDKHIYEDLMHMFALCPRLTQPVVVWRGIRARELVVGRLACQFVSTSLSLDSAMREEFTGMTCCVLRITLPAGSYVLPVEFLAEQAGEWEVILPPEGSWNVLSVEEVPYPGRTQWVTTYELTYLPKQRVALSQNQPEETMRKLVQLTETENAQRIAGLYDPEELELVYDGNVEEYINELANRIGALPVPPSGSVLALLR